MLPLTLDVTGELDLLVMGAHSDDIEIGCGGAVLSLLDRYSELRVRWVVFSGTGIRAAEARASAESFLGSAKEKEIAVLGFEESYFPTQHREIKQSVEGLKPFDPDLILTHAGNDLHQDHRLISELTWNTFRDHAILEYEIPKYDGDLAPCNAFFALDAEVCEKKCRLLREHFASQRDRHWFDDEVFKGLMRLRGMECGAPSGYAEGFHARKLRVG